MRRLLFKLVVLPFLAGLLLGEVTSALNSPTVPSVVATLQTGFYR